MTTRDSFSRRNQYAGTSKEITIREDAPVGLRMTVIQTANELGSRPSGLREVICRVLREPRDPNNWSERPNIWCEVQDLINGCEWFEVYDIIEALHANFEESDRGLRENCAAKFSEEINDYFVQKGVGWQLANGKVVARGDEAFESAVKVAPEALDDSGRPTASSHLHEAIRDLSSRPDADLSGAIFHAMGALEAVARDLTGDPKATLGQAIKRHPDLLPRPLGTAVSQLWGYASNEGRHVREGQELNRETAELVVGLAAVIATYLTRK